MPGYYKRQYNIAKRTAKRRYVRKTKSGNAKLNISKMARDLRYLKNSLNVEHKQFSTVYGLKTSADDPTIIYSPYASAIEPFIRPIDQSPQILPLALPSQGLKNMNRVGNNIKLTHISARMRVIGLLENFNTSGSKLATPTCTIMIGFFKPAHGIAGLADVSIDDIFEKDASGDYTRSSYRNKEKYEQFMFPRGLTKKVYLNNNGVQNNTGTTNGNDLIIEKYIDFNIKTSIKIPFTTGVTGATNAHNWGTAEYMRPFLLVMTNARGDGANGKTEVQMVGEFKFSYVDN